MLQQQGSNWDNMDVVQLATQRGEIVRGDDGDYIFWPADYKLGAFSATNLRQLADELDRLSEAKHTPGFVILEYRTLGCEQVLEKVYHYITREQIDRALSEFPVENPPKTYQVYPLL